MIESQRGGRCRVGSDHLIFKMRLWNCFIENAPVENYYDKSKKAPQNYMRAYHMCRARYNGSYTVMAKPIKTLELLYSMTDLVSSNHVYVCHIHRKSYVEKKNLV